jgi:competence protein ComEA
MVLRDRPVRESVSTRPVATATTVVATTTPGATTAGSSPTPPSMLVHVAGKVRKPGVVRLPPGSRVIDAVSASGGALNGVDLAALNLARPLTDGEQVLVGVTAPPGMPGQLPPAGSAETSSTCLPATPVNLNTATPAELETLPGVGPVLAQRIVEFRLSQGNFTSIEELRNVTGIGEQKYADLRDRVTV